MHVYMKIKKNITNLYLKNSLLSKDYKLGFVRKKNDFFLYVSNKGTDKPANNKGTDQTVHLHSLISTICFFCLERKIATLATWKISGF